MDGVTVIIDDFLVRITELVRGELGTAYNSSRGALQGFFIISFIFI